MRAIDKRGVRADGIRRHVVVVKSLGLGIESLQGQVQYIVITIDLMKGLEENVKQRSNQMLHQPRSNALSSLERKTLVGSGHAAPKFCACAFVLMEIIYFPVYTRLNKDKNQSLAYLPR